MAQTGNKLDRFDHLLPVDPWVNPWQPDGSYRADLDLLAQLLSAALGTSQRSGIVAAAVDVWAAEELRRSGFDPDEVWPRRQQPRVLPRDVRNFVAGLPKKLRAEVEQRYATSAARRALPAEAQVLGSAYSKQADVLVASWAAGVELLVSTKTMLSSYQNNLRNRFEEGYGDAKNIRGRHPLAALGFLFVVGSDIPEAGFEFAVDMLRKLVQENDVYECACLLVLDAPGGSIEEDDGGDERGPDDEPAALVPLDEAADLDPDFVESDGPAELSSSVTPALKVALPQERIPEDLRADRFFETLVKAALSRMPVRVYAGVRQRVAAAQAASGPSPST